LRGDLLGVTEVQSSGQSGSEALLKGEVFQETKLGYLVRRKIGQESVSFKITSIGGLVGILESSEAIFMGKYSNILYSRNL
jgi:hypothetical protein